MKINKLVIAMSLVVFSICFGLNGMKADAAIAVNYLDLRFTNNFTHNIVIEAIAKDGVLTVSLLRG